jgi:Putative Ig domain
MKKINITRDGTGKVIFETVSVDTTETVCFTNLDQQSAHWPSIASNQLGPAPSPNSSQCIVTPPPAGKTQVTYTCKIKGHEAEQGVINVFQPLAADNLQLNPAAKGSPIIEQQVVTGGMSPYQLSGQQFQITDASGNVIQSGAGVGPGLQLSATNDNTGVWVSGTPTVSGTYNFTFTVNDAMGRNLQQSQYSMVVA